MFNSINQSTRGIRVIAAPLIAGALSLLSLSATGSISLDGSVLQDLTQETQGHGLSSLIAGISIFTLYFHYWRDYKENRSLQTRLIAGLFAVFCVFGLSYAKNDSWDYIFASLGQFTIALLVFAGFFFLFDIAIVFLYQFLDQCASTSRKISSYLGNLEYPSIASRHPFAVALLCIFVAWLPYLILHLPGSVPYDGYRQINMGLGYEAISQHHPWLVSYFFAFVMRIGQVASDNVGVFLISILLYSAQAVCYALVCRNLKRFGAPVWLYFFSIGFFAIVPAFGTYAQSVIKDGTYSALFAYWFSEYIALCINLKRDKNISTLSVIYLSLLALLVSIWRNNGIFIVIPAQLLLAFFLINEKKKSREKGFVVTCAAIVFIIYYALNSVVAPALGVLPGPKKEALSVPFQQTARYLREYPEDVTESEANAIEAILDGRHLGERYNPERSDPVKDSFDNRSTLGDLLRYFKAWITMGLRHPDAYIQATLNNTFGYFYPGYNYSELGPYQLYIQGEPIATGDLDIQYIFPEKVRGLCDGWALLWRNFPVLSMVVNPATYTWLTILCTGYLIHRKEHRAIIPLIALFLNLAVCCISPVNGYLRYALPLMACVPTMFIWLYCCFMQNLGRSGNAKFVERKLRRESSARTIIASRKVV